MAEGEYSNGELQVLVDEIERAVIRKHTLGLVLKSGERELKTLRESRKGKSKPSALESATAKGMWGFNDYVEEYRERVKERKTATTSEVDVKVKRAPHAGVNRSGLAKKKML
jgi:hypothetical protein